MAPCTTSGLGDCSDCGPQDACCELDVSGVIVIWSGCGGGLPPINGWVADPTSPTGFSSKTWTTPPGKVYTHYVYEVTNSECDFTIDPEIMRRWEIAGWGLGSTRTFDRNLATDLRRCCGRNCTGGTMFPLYSDGAGPYDQDGNQVGFLDPCQAPPISGIDNRPPDSPTIFFDEIDSITVHHPCRVTADGAGTLEHCTVKVTAVEYTPAMHKAIVDAELLASGYPPYAMMRTIRHPSPCVINSPVDTAQVAWPADHIHCTFPSPFVIGADPTIAAKVIIRTSEPGLCNPLPGNSGPTHGLEIFKLLGTNSSILVADCFNCGERPVNVVPPP